MEGKFLLDTTNEPNPITGKPKCLKCGFTLVLTFGRRWCVKPFFENFMKMEIDMQRCHLLIFDNTDKILLQNELMPWAERLAPLFSTCRYYKSYREYGGTLRGAPWESIEKSKLPKIYAMHLDMLKLIHTKKFVLLEDDTLPPVDAVPRLLELLWENKDAGIVTGIETGRDINLNSKVRLGVHHVLRSGNRIMERISLDPNTEGVVEVDCCGWYCCASYVDVWRKGFEGFELYFQDIPRFALDGMHTNNIKQAGYKILADFSMWCDHMQACGGMIIKFNKEHAVKMADLWLPQYNNYAQGIIIKEKENELSEAKSKTSVEATAR